MGISERMGDVLGQAVESKLLKEVQEHPEKVTHLAIIMDGNRRFAWKSKIATGLGHRIGKQKLETVLDWVLELNIPWFTVYALSTENLTRPQEESWIYCSNYTLRGYVTSLKMNAFMPMR